MGTDKQCWLVNFWRSRMGAIRHLQVIVLTQSKKDCTKSPCYFRKIGDINVFGVIRGTQKMLPLIRKCKGRVVTITTPLVRGSTPSRSPYIFTKTAIVGFIECLRYEMKRFGVEVSQSTYYFTTF